MKKGKKRKESVKKMRRGKVRKIRRKGRCAEEGRKRKE